MRTHINFPSLSHLRLFFFSLSVRMVCSEHHRPRGMCSCLAIINMSYSWADRENIASHFYKTSDWQKKSFFFKCFKCFLILGKLYIFWLECPRDAASCFSFCLKCSGCCTKYVFTETECKTQEVLFHLVIGSKCKCAAVFKHHFYLSCQRMIGVTIIPTPMASLYIWPFTRSLNVTAMHRKSWQLGQLVIFLSGDIFCVKIIWLDIKQIQERWWPRP